ncbi:MAG: alpha-2-macroglobulin family protein, partial [Gemmobacter sp.]
RGYVLPASGDAAIPVQTVNATTLDLALFRVSDRNLVRAIQEGQFGAPMSDWEGGRFAAEVAEALWTGSASVPMEVNRDMTTRLPLGAALAGQPPGVYVLRAQVPGVDSYDSPPAWQWFVLSDLGITTLSGVDGLHVIVRSLATAAAHEGATVTLLSRSNRELGRAVTDAQGYARFDAGLTRGTGGAEPALVTVERAGDTAFLSLTEPEFDLADRGVAGREAAPPIDVFLTTDRGAYRAGETVFATALARDGNAAAIEGLPLTAILRRPDGVEYTRALVADAGGGGHVFALPVAGAAPRGIWRLEVFADPAARPLAARTFLVEDFLPERIDATLDTAAASLTIGGGVLVDVTARYLFGAPGADLAIEGEAVLRAAEGLAAFPGYRFGRADNPFSPVMEPVDPGLRTDATGRAAVAMRLPQVPDPGRPLEARLVLRLAEGSGRPIERAIVRPVIPAAPLIGIRPDYDGTVPEGAEATFRILAVGTDGAQTPLAARWALDRIETRYQWYQVYGTWNWEPMTTRTRIAEGTADLPATGAAMIAAPVRWGEYELTVTRADGQPGGSTHRFHAGWYAPADATQTPDTLDLSLDRPGYRPGETARLRIVPRAAGTVLVSVLSNRLVSMRAVEVPAGESIIDLPVTDDWGAGVYVTATLLRPMDVAAGRLPARAIGLAHAAIDPGPRRLTAAVEMPAEADPRGPLPVAVKVTGVQPGEQAWVTLAAVDVGILNLTAFASPDPAGHYFGQRRLGVGIRDVYGRLIDGLNGATGAVRSGGDGGNRNRLLAPPPTEELVAYFAGPIPVDADGYARTAFDLPSFNGTVRVMAVAWSKTGVGQAEAESLVRDPVVVTASLPRF